jgi:hypothetical protein
LGYRIAFQEFFRPAATFADAHEQFRSAIAPHLLRADFMKRRLGYAGVEMEDVARYILSQERVDGVRISLDTISAKIAALRKLPPADFSELKKMKNIDEVLPRLVVLEQTLMTFGYGEIQVFERELGVGLIVEKSIQLR